MSTCKLASILPACIDFKMFVGNTFKKVLQFGSSAAPIDLTGVTANFIIRNNTTDAAVLTLTIGDGLSVAGNIMTIDKIISLTAAVYRHELTVTFVDGEVRTFIAGPFEVKNKLTSNI
jgi:hypothetical protein